MANDCLVKRLKGVADNSNLPYYGGIKYHIFHIDTVGSNDHVLTFNGDMLILGNGTVTVNGVTHTKNDGVFNVPYPGAEVYFSNEDFDVIFLNKYTTTGIRAGIDPKARIRYSEKGISVDLSDFNYADGLTEIAANGIRYIGEGKFTNFKDMTFFQLINVQNPVDVTLNATINSIDLVDNTILQYFFVQCNTQPQYDRSGLDITLNLAHFGNKTELLGLLCPFSKTTGEVADMAAAMVANGRTSGTLDVALINTQATVEGTLFNEFALQEKYSTPNPVYAVNITFDSSLPNGYKIEAA